MSPRRLLGVSLLSAAVGIVALVVAASNADRDTAATLAVIAMLGSLLALGGSILLSMRSLRTAQQDEYSGIRQAQERRDLETEDVETIAGHLGGLRADIDRLQASLNVITKELTHGPISHMPGQVARMEGSLSSESSSVPSLIAGSDSPSPASEFDRVYVLNLDRDVKKLAHLTDMFAKHGLDFTRFAATDGNDPAFDEAWNAYESKGLVTTLEKSIDRRLIESRGAWGYLMTMQALLAHAGQQGHRRILVFDDDVMLHRNFQSRFTEVWTEIPADWKLVYLGSEQADSGAIPRYSEHLYQPGAMANGSYAIALDSSVFNQAIASASRFEWPFDAGPLREIDVAFPSLVFSIDPPLAVADISTSSIREGRNMEAHAALNHWNLDDYESPLDTSVGDDLG
jgi:hypothetical protein